MASKNSHNLIKKKYHNLKEKTNHLIKQRAQSLLKTLEANNLLHELCNDSTNIIVQELEYVLAKKEATEAQFFTNIKSIKTNIEELDKACDLQRLKDEMRRISDNFLNLEEQYDNQAIIDSQTNIEEKHNITLAECEIEATKQQNLIELFQVNFQEQENLMISSDSILSELEYESEIQLELEKIKTHYLQLIRNC